MKTIKELLKLVGVMCLCAFCIWFGYQAALIAQKYPEPFKIPSIPDIQRAVGAEPDGIVGPDTIGKWEIAYANQEAAKFMTPSGGPEE